jgi:NAD(P)-dependent dehydrogenase (short-subunit alcohol dehydrogenase family)
MLAVVPSILLAFAGPPVADLTRVTHALVGQRNVARTHAARAVLADPPTQPMVEKLYKRKEAPKVAGGLRIGTRRPVVITGASSGLGLAATKALCDEGYFVVAAVRDTGKMDAVAREIGISRNDYVAMRLELGSLQSVKDFVSNLKLFLPARPISHLICNAAVYLPTDPVPSWTDDGYEMSLGVNHLGHFLLVQLLLPDLKRARGSRCCIVGSVTGNSNTIAGKFVKPVAELGALCVMPLRTQRCGTGPTVLRQERVAAVKSDLPLAILCHAGRG